MNAFDQSILSPLNHLAGHFWKLDFALFSLSDNEMMKGGLFMVALWALWFRSRNPHSRQLVIATLLGAFLAVVLGKCLEHILPLRIRPYQADLPGLFFPYDMGLEDQTSFPSDHATLFFALATGLFYCHRTIGLSAFLYATFFICLPRIYLGLHYPSDILVGAGLGIASAIFTQSALIQRHLSIRLITLSFNHPGLFYPLLFFVTFEVATLFDGLRDLARLAHILV